MARKCRRRLRVPKALRRAYGDRVQTLQSTILSLLPSPPPVSPSECRCQGRGCLGCLRSTHLLRPDDPPDYRRMLTRGFCALNPEAPPAPRIYHGESIGQLVLVRNTMELILDNLPGNVLSDVHLRKKNVIFIGYSKQSQFSPNYEALCTAAWDLLLSRVGNSLMVFLLQFSSIFVPLLNKSHYQVTGSPLNMFIECPRFWCSTSLSRNQQHMCFRTTIDGGHMGNRSKKRSDNGKVRNVADSTFVLDSNSLLKVGKTKIISSVSIASNKRQRSLGECKRMNSQRNAPFNEEVPSGMEVLQVACPTSEYDRARRADISFSSDSQEMHAESDVSSWLRKQCGAPDTDVADKSNCDLNRKSKKRVRLFSWQRLRCKKAKILQNVLSNDDKEPSTTAIHSSSDVNLDNELSQQTRLVAFGMTPEPKEKKILNIPESCSSEVAKEVGCEVSHIISEKTNRGQAILSVGIIDHVPGLASAELEKESHPDLVNSTLQDKLLKNACSTKQHESCTRFENPSLCLYCMMVHSSKKISLKAQIKRSFILYNRFSSSFVFPKSHILNRIKPNDSGAARLMKHIFGFPDGRIQFIPCADCTGHYSSKSQCLYHTLLSLLKSLIRNAQRCQYQKLFLKHCSVQACKQHLKENGHSKCKIMEVTSSKTEKVKKYESCNQSSRKRGQQHERSSKDGVSDLEPIDSYISHHQVVSFIWAVCRSLIPVPLLGSSSTWRPLIKNISRFIRLRRFENYSLKQCIHGLKVSCYPFLSKLKSSECFCEDETKFQSGNVKTIRKQAKVSNDVNMMLLENIFHSWIYWFFSYMVVSIVSANFYVTERQSKKHDLFYYPKSVWRKLVKGTIACLTDQEFKMLEHTSVMHILDKRLFGFSKVRFLPKEKGVRLLANFRRPSKVRVCNCESGTRIELPFVGTVGKAQRDGNQRKTYKKWKVIRYKSANSALNDLYVILRGIKAEDPELLGSSVFDYNDVYKKLHQFLYTLRSRSLLMPKIFIVAADVSKAFDSINQDMLINILRKIIQNDIYILKKYARIICWKNSIKILYEHMYHSISRMNGHALNSEASVCLPAPSSSSGFLVDQGFIKRIQKENLHSLLYEHVKHNILQFGHEFYLQKIGISQGSFLSCLLCSFYYGHLERSVLLPYLEKVKKESNKLSVEKLKHAGRDCASVLGANVIHDAEPPKHYVALHLGKSINVEQCKHNPLMVTGKSDQCSNDHHCTSVVSKECSAVQDSLLLRYIDDFLFISTSKEQAVSFYNRMRRGFIDYNCFMNKEKFGLNFYLEESTCLPNRIYTGRDGKSFIPWCGLLLNPHTLEIQADYTRYCGIDMSSTLTVQDHAKPGYYIKLKLCDFTRIKCHPIFYDSNINSPAIIRLNAYQAFLLCAMKFHCLTRGMKDIAKLKPAYLLEIVERSFSYMYKLIKKLMMDMVGRFGIHPDFRLLKREIIWLGFSAYIRVLKKKQSRHKELLSALRSRISTYEMIVHTSSDLRYAVDDSHSSVFWAIEF